MFALIVLGFVQGLCEFLPVSSSGHLVLLSKLFGIQDSLFVSIILHVATLLAVVVVMRKEIFYLIRNPFSPYTISLALATISTCLVVIFLMPYITSAFEGVVLPVFFALSGVILLIVSKQKDSHKKITYKRAVIIGLAQGLAIFPGLSRSGTTISVGFSSKSLPYLSASFSGSVVEISI